MSPICAACDSVRVRVRDRVRVRVRVRDKVWVRARLRIGVRGGVLEVGIGVRPATRRRWRS